MSVAWSEIQNGDEVIKAGESVSSGSFDDEEEFNRLVEVGVIREDDYPDDVAPNESIRERNIRVVSERMAQLQEEAFDPEKMSDLDLVPEVPAQEPPGGQEAADKSNEMTGGGSSGGSSGGSKAASKPAASKQSDS